VGFAGVSGGAASGKKTVCDMIIQQLHDHRVVLVNQVRIFFFPFGLHIPSCSPLVLDCGYANRNVYVSNYEYHLRVFYLPD
jgi:hypothetical protein